MKTYMLTVSRKFPGTHKRRGEETSFVERILSGEKIHTIRGNYKFWRKRFDKIESGEACLSIRYWSGRPYHSETIEFLRLTREDGIGIQKVEINTRGTGCRIDDGVWIFDRGVTLARNDGLGFRDFKEWFKNYDLSQPMAIIHFTVFRYD